jgi:hypothetical protein
MPYEMMTQPTNRAMVRQMLTDPNTFATTMVIALMDHYGPELFTWSPQTIRMETEDDFSFKWPQLNFDRLMAGIVLVATDRFYVNLPDFIELCNVLSGAGFNPTMFDPADALECAWGITEALLLAPPDNDEAFNEEIRAYIGKVLDGEGILQAPDILRIALRDKDHIAAVTEFSGDNDLYSAIWQNERAKTQDINDVTKARLILLITQLGALKLTNGNTTEIAKRMLSNFSPSEGSPLQ